MPQKGRDIERDRKLTSREATQYDKIREQIEEEIPPAKTNIVRDTIARLRSIREQQGITLADMQSRTGMTRANLSKLENESRSVHLRTLERYARALGCRLEISVLPRVKSRKQRLA